MTTTNVRDTVINFHVKLRGQNCENAFFHKRLTINDNTQVGNMLRNDIFNKAIQNS